MDLDETLRRLNAAEGDPIALALATADIVLASHQPEVALALEASAVPHWFDESVLRFLLGDALPSGNDWFDQLVHLTMVEPFRAHSAWNVHEVTRLALRKRLALDQTERFRSLSRRASDVVDGEAAPQRIERIYHQLTCDPDQGVVELGRMWKKWESLDQLEPLQSLAKNLDELCTTRLLAPKARAHALMVVGSIREDRVPMREWEATAREALELMKASDDQVGLVNAQSLWAKVLRAQGRFGESLEVCESALEGLRRLGPSVIGEAAYSDVEVDLLTGKGKTLRERGQSREALADFEAAAAIRQRVSDEDSENELKRRRLAVAHVNLADTLRDTPRSDEAAAYFFRAMEVIQSPRGADFGAETAEQEVASLQARYGDLLLTGGDEVGALKQFEKAEATLRRLTTADPDQLSWKDDLAQMYVRIGNIYCSRGELENGDTRFTWARDILAALAERDPTNPSWKHSVGNICAAIGVLRQEQSRWSEAVKEYIEAERVLGELALSDPDAVSWQLAHATARQALGQLFEKVAPAFENETEKINFLTRAVIQFNGAQTTLSRLVERDAGNSTWQSSLAWVYRQKAGVLETLAEWIESGVKVEDVDMSPQRLYESSRTAYLSSLNIMSQLVTQTPGNTSFRRELALSATGAGRLSEKLDQFKDAELSYAGALLLAESLHKQDETNSRWASDLETIKTAVARVKARLAESENATGQAPPRSE